MPEWMLIGRKIINPDRVTYIEWEKDYVLFHFDSGQELEFTHKSDREEFRRKMFTPKWRPQDDEHETD